MHSLTLRYKGFSLKLVFKANTYYTKTPFEPGKTLYQTLFEHLIDGKTVSCHGLAKHYKKVNSYINPGAISQLLKRIEAAVKKSPNRKLRKKHFKRPQIGGASPVLSRKSPISRFTPAQREIFEKTIGLLHKQGKRPRYKEIRRACLNSLQKKGLAGNVILSDLAIWRAKKRLGLPIRPPPRPKPPRRRP